MMNSDGLKISSITKSFGATPAVKEACFEVQPGETMALLGENGAGKSTLMKVIAGVHPHGSYSGTFSLGGNKMCFGNVRDAEKQGIVLVPQELHIAPNLSIVENILMGNLPSKFGILDNRAAYHKAKKCLEFFDLNVDPLKPASILSASEQRLIMISATLSKSATRVLILDEPTASLTEGEAENLFKKMEQVKEAGVATIYITHRLDEIEKTCDRAVVMRNGRVVLESPNVSGRRHEFVRSMIGRDPDIETRVVQPASGRKTLEVRNLRVTGGNSAKSYVEDVSLDVHAGEIVGMFGLVGAGRSELASAIFGAWDGEVEGDVTIGGKPGRPTSPREAIQRKVAMLNEDRKRAGIIEGQSALRNISAASLNDVCNAYVIQYNKERERNLRLATELDLRPLDLDLNIENFSGGNQQKLMLVRLMAINPDLLIVDEPTYGVDIGARYGIYKRLRKFTDAGKSILFISSDLEEIINETDRVLVMYKGRITGEFAHGASRHSLMAAATGETLLSHKIQ